MLGKTPSEYKTLMEMTLSEMRFCFRGSLLAWYREEQRRYEGYTVLAMANGAQEDPFNEIAKSIQETISELMITDPKKPLKEKTITDATIRNQILQSGIPFTQVKV